jgi:hypothetical protein
MYPWIGLSRGEHGAQGLAPKDVKMKVRYFLATLLTDVRDQPPATRQTRLARHMARRSQQFATQIWVPKVVHRAHVQLGDHQHVDGGLGVDIVDYDHVLRGIDPFCGHIASGDFAENTVQNSRPAGGGLGQVPGIQRSWPAHDRKPRPASQASTDINPLLLSI